MTASTLTPNQMHHLGLTSLLFFSLFSVIGKCCQWRPPGQTGREIKRKTEWIINRYYLQCHSYLSGFATLSPYSVKIIKTGQWAMTNHQWEWEETNYIVIVNVNKCPPEYLSHHCGRNSYINIILHFSLQFWLYHMPFMYLDCIQVSCHHYLVAKTKQCSSQENNGVTKAKQRWHKTEVVSPCQWLAPKYRCWSCVFVPCKRVTTRSCVVRADIFEIKLRKSEN